MLISPVYLAGGMHSEWRKPIIKAFPEIEFFDPTTHGYMREDLYTAWDLTHVRKCETVLAYMDTANPSGFGMNLELGYAKALSKRIILVSTLKRSDPRHRSFGMARSIADQVFHNLDLALWTLGSETRGEGDA